LGAAAAHAGLLAGAPALAQARRPPNFIIILCDDLGYGDIGPYGNRVITTPALDRMARDGVTLTDFYAAASMCTPSRAGLLTGRYPIRSGLAYEVIIADDTRGLPLAEVTIAEALKPAYATAMIGKWHLGHVAPHWPPTRHGFDLFFGLPYSHDMKNVALYDSAGPGVELTREDVDFPRLQQRFFDRARRFVADHRDRPFFLTLALTGPHLPQHPHPDFKGTSVAGAYGDVVAEIDAGVGALLDQLGQLGIAGDTLVVFTSDNGPWYEGSAGPLRDRKGGGAWDGGYRVPAIFWRPGTLPPGRRSAAIAMSIDLLPTFCAMAGVARPRGVILDGRDITAVLTRDAPSPHDQLLLFYNQEIWGLRTQRWKFVVATRWREKVVTLGERGYDALYDVAADPSESYNLADRYPDVVTDLRARLMRAREDFAPMVLKEIPDAFRRLPPQSRHID
jgi:uncharacterized sulfatase